MTPRIFVLLLALLAPLGGAGCPSAADLGAPGKCTELHTRCTLPSGVLGVCNDAPCPDGQPSGCLKCTSQH